jgi:hypothetical protein
VGKVRILPTFEGEVGLMGQMRGVMCKLSLVISL